MTLLRRGLWVTAAAVLVVAVGVAINQVFSEGRWDARWLISAIVLAAGAGALNVWLGKRDSARPFVDAAPVLWPDLVGGDGLPLSLSEVTPRALGVHASRSSRDGNSPYIAWQPDSVLTAALMDAGGPPAHAH